MSIFEQVMAFILPTEGPESNDPKDPGGRTKFGISQAAHPDVNFDTLTLNQALHIYQAEYWDQCRCSDLPAALAFVVMDAAVNEGVAASRFMMQEALGVKADGVIGPITLTAAKAQAVRAPAEFTARRAVRYAHDPNFGRNGLGWCRRYINALLQSERVEP